MEVAGYSVPSKGPATRSANANAPVRPARTSRLRRRIRLATGEVDTADVIQRYEEGAQGPVVSIDGEAMQRAP